jgi:signal transduction histidine kinase/CheY-like chemotaxis protein
MAAEAEGRARGGEPAPLTPLTPLTPIKPAPTPAEGTPAPPGALKLGTEFDHLRALYLQTPVTLTGNLMGMLLMALTFGLLAERPLLISWLAVGALLWLLRLAHYLRFRRRGMADAEQLRRWRISWRALVLAQGATWGLAVWLFWGLGTPYHAVSLILIVYSYCLGSVQMLATQSRTFLCFTSLVLVPTIVRIASDSKHAWHLQLSLILALLFGITVLMARSYGGALSQAILLKARTDDLAARLRAETEAAEQARRAAEAANRAKTQFFAAASHDLRQPLHALGLFAEALRQRSHEPEVTALVNSVNESVDALEGLFGELLDITRIDTGGVEVNPAPLRMEELFARLRLQFLPVAFEKGLALRFRGGLHVAQADTLLIERILRNLVSNAIRYTDDGGVLVSCRPRGQGLLLQVWDSGIGIAPASLPRIWDEFYQVHSQRPLQAHQRKGLGLGLAIVRRLAQLMNASLDVRSRVGHGSVFSIRLPRGKAPLDSPEDLSGGLRPPPGLTLQGCLIVVVEDELAVREGLVVLLQAWGARVLSFDALDTLGDWLAQPAAEQPDLLLLDYRLPQGCTGIEALTALRARWPGSRLPAILITGSSLDGHEDEALLLDYHLLIKPVPPNKLRAMIAFKLGVRPTAPA